MVSEVEWQQKMVVDYWLPVEEKAEKNLLFLTKHCTKDKKFIFIIIFKSWFLTGFFIEKNFLLDSTIPMLN